MLNYFNIDFVNCNVKNIILRPENVTECNVSYTSLRDYYVSLLLCVNVKWLLELKKQSKNKIKQSL